MKKIALFFLALVLCFSMHLNVYSVSIDGIDKGAEWDGAETQIILNGESNCKANFGLIKWISEPETNNIFLCVMFKDPYLQSDNTNAGVSLQIDNSDPFIVTVNSSPEQYDVDKYYFDGAVMVDSNGGATCELRIGLKFGLPDTINGKIRFYDSDGSPSNVYDFIIENTSATEEYDYIYNGEYNEITNPPSTATIKYTTATHKTTHINPKTTVASKTTTKRNNDSHNSMGILDLLIPEKTSAAPAVHTENKTKTETLRTTKKNKKTTNKNIAETKAETTVIDTATVSASTESVPEETVISTTTQNTPTNNSKLDAYKFITIVAGGISLVTISVLGTLKAKKQDNNDDSSDTA